MGSLFRVPLSAFDDPAGKRVALVPERRNPAPRAGFQRRGRARTRRGAGRAAAGSARALRGASLDPPARRRRVAQRRDGRRNRALRAGSRAKQAQKSGRPAFAGRTRDSPSRFRFRPPRPTGLSPRDCSLFVRPLGRGFDLLALRARRKEEPMRSRSPDQDQASTFLSQFAASIIFGGRSTRCPRRRRTAGGRTTRSTRAPRSRPRRAASASARARPTRASSSRSPAGRAPRA